MNRKDAAALIAGVVGHEIAADTLDPAALGADAAPMRPMFDHYDRAGLRGNALTLTSILGHEPRTLRAYFEQLASSRTVQK